VQEVWCGIAAGHIEIPAREDAGQARDIGQAVSLLRLAIHQHRRAILVESQQADGK
jgi:hypothetical protein